MLKIQKLAVHLSVCLLASLTLLPSAKASEIQFSGEVSAASMADLVARVAKAYAGGDRTITVQLDSLGGDLIAALRANAQLRSYDVNTLVTNECSSSCTVLFAAGRRRFARFDATFVFHAVQISKKSRKFFGDSMNKSVHQAYVDDYVSKWLAAVRAVSPSLADYLQEQKILASRSRLFKGSELRRYGYVN